MTKKTDLQDIFLSKLSEDKISVSIYLLNGIKLQGTIDSFDQYVVVLSGSTPQLISSMPFQPLFQPKRYNLKQKITINV